MPNKLPALQSTYLRQTKVGNLCWIICALWIFYPYVNDRIRGEPAIASKLEYAIKDNQIILNESTYVKYPNRGSRNNVIYDSHDNIVCLKNISSIWDKSFDTKWTLNAYSGCNAYPDEPIKACTIFSIYSKSGIERKVGKDEPICTEYFTVKTDGIYASYY